MRLIPRHRHSRREKLPRIVISQAEITADLHYPESRPQSLRGSENPRRGVAR
jgi:hypothetical protein